MGAGRDINGFGTAVNQGNLDLGAEYRLADSNLDAMVEVVTDALKPAIGLDVNLDIEVTSRRTSLTRSAPTRESKTRPVLDTGRNLHRNRSTHRHKAIAFAFGASMLDELTLAAALRTRGNGHDAAEEGLPGHLHASSTATGWTGDRVVAWLRAGSVAPLARSRRTKLDLPVGGDRGFREGQRDRSCDIGATTRAGSLASKTAAEELLQDVIETAEL